jgi:hypothetical protein
MEHQEKVHTDTDIGGYRKAGPGICTASSQGYRSKCRRDDNFGEVLQDTYADIVNITLLYVHLLVGYIAILLTYEIVQNFGVRQHARCNNILRSTYMILVTIFEADSRSANHQQDT